MEEAAPNPSAPTSRERKQYFGGAKDGAREYCLVARRPTCPDVDKIKLMVCVQKADSTYEELRDEHAIEVKVNDTSYNQYTGEDLRLGAGQDPLVPFKVTGLDDAIKYKFGTKIHIQGSEWKGPSGVSFRNPGGQPKKQAKPRKRKAKESVDGPSDREAAGAAPAPAAPAPAAPAPAPAAPWATTNGQKCLIIPRANQPNLKKSWTSSEVWAWIITLLAASRASDLKTVPQGTLFEVIVAACLSFVYGTTANVELKGASSTPGQGDDGTDIIIQKIDNNIPNEIFDCKNYSEGTKGTRPNVRSVIGALMTSEFTTGTDNAKGIGTLLVTSSFTDGALASKDKFNDINYLTAYSVRCWTFEKDFEELFSRAFRLIGTGRLRNIEAKELLTNILQQLGPEDEHEHGRGLIRYES